MSYLHVKRKKESKDTKEKSSLKPSLQFSLPLISTINIYKEIIYYYFKC